MSSVGAGPGLVVLGMFPWLSSSRLDPPIPAAYVFRLTVPSTWSTCPASPRVTLSQLPRCKVGPPWVGAVWRVCYSALQGCSPAWPFSLCCPQSSTLAGFCAQHLHTHSHV